MADVRLAAADAAGRRPSLSRRDGSFAELAEKGSEREAPAAPPLTILFSATCIWKQHALRRAFAVVLSTRVG